MAIPIFTSTISRSNPCSCSIPSNLCNFDLVRKKKRRFSYSHCVPFVFHPVLHDDLCCPGHRAELSFSIGTHIIPHPNKVDRGGEDAFFVSSYNGGVLAIADGVSGWAERGIDPALFSHELMANASYSVGDEEVNDDPQLLLWKAHAATSSIGSATAIIAMLEKNGVLKIANVGDCGLRVLREGLVIFSTSPQEHYFDCPFQLSSEICGQTYQDALVSRVELIESDTIVMGSDGLFDNVFDHEIVSMVSRIKDVTEAAKALANLASSHSRDIEFDSPYSMEARSRGFDIPLWKKILGKKLTALAVYPGQDNVIFGSFWKPIEASRRSLALYPVAVASGGL